jgi:hypothetical protein
MTASRLRKLLLLFVLGLTAGCGAGWRGVPLDSLGPATESLGGEHARFTLKDERVLEMRILEVKYPFVEGHRVIGEWSTERKLRVDLREVSRVEVRNAPG